MRARRAQGHGPKTLALSGKADGAPRLWAGHFVPDPARSESAHIHKFFELLFVEGGRGYHLLDGERLAAQEGDLFWMSPGQLHDPSGLSGCVKWVIAFNADAVLPGSSDGESFFAGSQSLWLAPFAPSAVASRKVNVPRPERPEALAHIEGIARELREKPLGYAEAASLHLRLLLTELARLSEPVWKGARAHQPLIGAVFAVIEARYRSPIGLRDVAGAVGRSPAYLTDLIRRETGRTVLQWILERRLAETRRLLLGSDESLARIAEHVGYGDPKHLAAQFRKAHGESPRAWRLARREAKERTV